MLMKYRGPEIKHDNGIWLVAVRPSQHKVHVEYGQLSYSHFLGQASQEVNQY